MIAVVCIFLTAVICVFSVRRVSPILTDNDIIPTTSIIYVTRPDDRNAITNGKLNINIATAEDLEMLPGIGEALAQRIIEYRLQYGPFKTTEELLKVKGIGPSKLDAIHAYITTS